MDVIILILTFNEEIHLKRCINSCLAVTKSIVVVDSFSNDKTVSIAKEMGANVLFRDFDNHSNQLNWALNKLKGKAKWIMRVDADEIISEHLSSEIKTLLPTLNDDVAGIFIKRNIIFLNKLIRFGGCYKRETMRIVRPEKTICEKRLMDEHFLVNGRTINFSGVIYDHSLKPLSLWIDKHNSYASKEAAEMIKLKIKNNESIKKYNKIKLPQIVFLKNIFYSNLPLFLRPFLYFIYRYFLKLGFLDGKEGFIFHFMQSFWYRNLVDAKIFEVNNFSKKYKKSLSYSIKKSLDINF